MTTLHNKLRHLSNITGKGEKFALDTIHIETDRRNANGEICTRLQAANGRMAIQAEHTSVDGMPVTPGFDANANRAQAGMVPAKAFTAALKGCPKKPHLPVLANAAMTITPDTITFATADRQTDLQTSTITPIRTVEGTYPDIDKCFPATDPIATFCVDPNMLATLLITIADITDTSRVLLSIYSPDNTEAIPMRIDTPGDRTNTTIRALVMPRQDWGHDEHTGPK